MIKGAMDNVLTGGRGDPRHVEAQVPRQRPTAAQTPGALTNQLPIDLPPIGTVGLQRASRISAVSLPCATWAGSVCNTEWTFHQLSPYIGKSKFSMAAAIKWDLGTRQR